MPKRYWYIILTYLLVQLALPFPIVIGLKWLAPGLTNSQIETYALLGAYAIGLVFFLYLLKPDMQRSEMRNGPGIGGIIKWSLLGVVLAYLTNIVVNLINIEIIGLEGGSENTEMIMNKIEENWLFLLLPILFAPIFEEIIFRKIIFGQLNKKMNFFFAALISSLAFAALHLDFEFILSYFAMGVVFAYLYVKTNRIIVPIFAHMAMNTIAVVLSLAIDVEDLERRLEEMENAATIILGGLI
ncbi:CPBP family intramembrane metalloprotease [Halalkalibacillus sediminis]|uniref:CPBP family intramembrane metalloprotease n=1 Tax=Halalkalibacillus sediminis TaxID=2018042 RepID=A0A2I0QQB2_9BACI|nr:type II CAAX endopeptidase family protein [Halalkalibacillus sediminis]PKR76525.1 CPBP family intramembrane metalloprotease [Halalkalibacillus sediminis]